MKGRLIRRFRARVVVAAAVALLAPALAATPASAVDIVSSGPLTNISLGDTLQCQVEYAGAGGQFFPGVGGQPGSCFSGLLINGAPANLTLVSQSPAPTGSGTPSDPFTVVTDLNDSAQPQFGLTRTDSYVVGENFYRTDLTVSTDDSTFDAVVWHGADCYLNGDAGYGFHDATTGGTYCTENANSLAASYEGFVPLTRGENWFEGEYSTATSGPSANGYPNTCDCASLLDNGMGLSWNLLQVLTGLPQTVSFRTHFSIVNAAQPPPPPGPPTTLAGLPNPTLGKTVNVQRLSGVVLIGVPKGAAGAGARSGARASQKGLTFVPLSQVRQIPVGSLLNTRRGKVRVQSARDQRGTRQNGDFSRGLFQVLQSRKRAAKGLTEVRLKGSSFKSCKTTRPRKGRAAASASRRIRRISASTRGRFRTRGRHSSATVRGTKWTMTDRCDGTLTTVARGKVAVRDFRRRKTIVVKAGKSYLARARR